MIEGNVNATNTSGSSLTHVAVRTGDWRMLDLVCAPLPVLCLTRGGLFARSCARLSSANGSSVFCSTPSGAAIGHAGSTCCA